MQHRLHRCRHTHQEFWYAGIDRREDFKHAPAIKLIIVSNATSSIALINRDPEKTDFTKLTSNIAIINLAVSCTLNLARE